MPTPSIDTLLPDIQDILKRKDGWFTPQLATEFAKEVESRLSARFNREETKPTLRLSKMGPVCPCALWHSIHKPEEAEQLPPWAELKYTYGDLIEALVISLAKASGHDVRGEQDRVVVDGIAGHRDCVIDGCICDVKSTTSWSFQKFKDGSIRLDDSFGYLDQLDGYLVGSLEDPIVTVKDRAYLIAVDKQLGHICKYEHFIRSDSIRNRIAEHKRIIALGSAPKCTCRTEPYGKSGNIALAYPANYNPFKYCCFPNLRTFLYASGPVYLTKVVKTPDVVEIDRYGKLVYT